MEENSVKGYLCFMYEYSGGFRYQFSPSLEKMEHGLADTCTYKKKVTAGYIGQIVEATFSEDYERIFFKKKISRYDEKVVGLWPNTLDMVAWKEENARFLNAKKSINEIKNIKLENLTLKQLNELYTRVSPSNRSILLAKIVEKIVK